MTMLPVIWTQQATDDLLDIIRYIGEINPMAATRLQRRLETVVFPLSEHPLMYPQSAKMPEYREIVAHPNDLVFYQVLADKVQIEMVSHGRRNFPISR